MNAYEVLIATLPHPVDSGSLSLLRNTINEMPKKIKKYFLGPLRNSDDSRTFIALPIEKIEGHVSLADQIKACRSTFINNVLSCQARHLVNIEFGSGMTTIKQTTDTSVCSSDELTWKTKCETLANKNRLLECEVEIYKKWRKSDQVIDEAIQALERVNAYREVVENMKSALDASHLGKLNADHVASITKLLEKL